jgi:hypothetical protein
MFVYISMAAAGCGKISQFSAFVSAFRKHSYQPANEVRDASQEHLAVVWGHGLV